MIQRQIEILAKGCAECGLETTVDPDLFEHSGKQVARHGVQNLGERARLGLDAR